MLFSVEQLNSEDPTELACYERAFYRAFEKVTSNHLIQTLWAWDHGEKRLALKVPYSDQEVYILRDANGEIDAAVAYNMALRQFQSSAFGFEKPNISEKYFEIMTLFSKPESYIKSRMRLLESTRQHVVARGFRYAFATTAEPVLPLYLRLGGTLLQKTRVQSEMRYFLKFDLNFAFMKTIRNEL